MHSMFQCFSQLQSDVVCAKISPVDVGSAQEFRYVAAVNSVVVTHTKRRAMPTTFAQVRPTTSRTDRNHLGEISRSAPR